MPPTNLAASGGSGAATVIAIVVIAALIGLKLWYDSFKEKGFRPRSIDTGLSADQLRRIFQSTVAGTGWSIIDEGNPMIAQSALLAGIRQQIALEIGQSGGRTHVRIATIRYAKKVFGGATKAYTLRWRMNAFIAEVRRADTSASVAG